MQLDGWEAYPLHRQPSCDTYHAVIRTIAPAVIMAACEYYGSRAPGHAVTVVPYTASAGPDRDDWPLSLVRIRSHHYHIMNLRP